MSIAFLGASRLQPPSAAGPAQFDAVDWLRFADRFRGSEEAIRERQQIYAARFREGAAACSIWAAAAAEMLEVFRDAGIAARGIDLHAESIAVCRSKGLDAELADAFAYLRALPGCASLGGLVCCQVVEQPLPAGALARTDPPSARQAAARGRIIAIETPNPKCLAIFATHFYIDPTHRHPIPPALADFYLDEAGLRRVEIERLSPAVDARPALAELPEAFRKEFSGLDYVAFATKLG